MTKGWKNEPTRHSLAARNIKTVSRAKKSDISSSSLGKVIENALREQQDICQAGLEIAERLTEKGEQAEYNRIWKIVQDSVRSNEHTDHYRLSLSADAQEVTQRIKKAILQSDLTKDIERDK